MSGVLGLSVKPGSLDLDVDGSKVPHAAAAAAMPDNLAPEDSQVPGPKLRAIAERRSAAYAQTFTTLEGASWAERRPWEDDEWWLGRAQAGTLHTFNAPSAPDRTPQSTPTKITNGHEQGNSTLPRGIELIFARHGQSWWNVEEHIFKSALAKTCTEIQFREDPICRMVRASTVVAAVLTMTMTMTTTPLTRINNSDGVIV